MHFIPYTMQLNFYKNEYFAKSKIFFQYLKVDNKNAYYLHMLKAQILVNFNLRGEYLIQGLIMLRKNLPTQLSLVLFFFFFKFFVTETKP